MSVLFALLFLLSSLSLAVGFASPQIVLPWTENKTRKRVVVTYGIATFVFALLTGVTASPAPEEQAIAPSPQPDEVPRSTPSKRQSPSPSTVIPESSPPAANRTNTSPTTSPAVPKEPSVTRVLAQGPSGNTDAVITGNASSKNIRTRPGTEFDGNASSKNIRTRPGTEFEVKHTAYPGDRVQILDSAQDSGGYTWYKVQFPKSGVQGWIAAQLIEQDGSSVASESKEPSAPTLEVTPGSSVTRNSSSSGKCNYPDDLDAAGKRCGKRAASERPGGR